MLSLPIYLRGTTYYLHTRFCGVQIKRSQLMEKGLAGSYADLLSLTAASVGFGAMLQGLDVGFLAEELMECYY
jgi:hypothetical protein